MLTLRGVSKHFDGTTVLHPLDLTIEPGKTTVLLGPSGSGKSTLLRLMVGLILPDTGNISFESQPLTSRNLPQLRQHMGYVIQDGGLFPHLNARDNILLMARQLGWDSTRIEKRLLELAELTHIPLSALHRFPVHLSGGQKQRIALMRALMLDPKLLLLDEPMAALDPLIRHELQQDLRDIFLKLHKTVVLVTHDLSEAGFLGDRVLLLNDGRVVHQGSFASLVDSPADPFVTRFVQAQRLPNFTGDSLDEPESAGPLVRLLPLPDGIHGSGISS